MEAQMVWLVALADTSPKLLSAANDTCKEHVGVCASVPCRVAKRGCRHSNRDEPGELPHSSGQYNVSHGRQCCYAAGSRLQPCN
jgi:hypothetical protein